MRGSNGSGRLLREETPGRAMGSQGLGDARSRGSGGAGAAVGGSRGWYGERLFRYSRWFSHLRGPRICGLRRCVPGAGGSGSSPRLELSVLSEVWIRFAALRRGPAGPGRSRQTRPELKAGTRGCGDELGNGPGKQSAQQPSCWGAGLGAVLHFQIFAFLPRKRLTQSRARPARGSRWPPRAVGSSPPASPLSPSTARISLRGVPTSPVPAPPAARQQRGAAAAAPSLSVPVRREGTHPGGSSADGSGGEVNPDRVTFCPYAFSCRNICSNMYE